LTESISPNLNTSTPLAHRDRGFDILAVVVSRVAIFALLYWTALTFDKESLARGLVLIYGLSSILYLATWVAQYRARNASPVGVLLYFQFLVEVLVEAAIFCANDGYLSDYGLLFIITILSAGFFFRYAGALVVALTAATIFGFVGLVHLGFSVPIELSLPRIALETVQVRFFLYSTLFFMVALLSSLLAGRLQSARKELEGAHRAMDVYQFSAETVMNGLPTGLLFFDELGLLKFKNGLCEEWLGKALDQGMLMAAVLEDIVHKGTVAEILKLKSHFPYTELEVETAMGRPLHLQIKSISRDKNFFGVVILLIDFTEERRMAKALLRAERMATIGGMSARIAHEIRNPLASITGSAQMLEGTELNNEMDRKLFGLIVTESARLERILSGLLDYSRDSKPSYRMISISAIFIKIQLMLEKTPGFDKNLVITNHFIENGDIEFSCDQDILVQVLLNVSLNALQALAIGKGTLDFIATTDDRNVFLKVKDNGTGMTPQEVSKAFEPFITSKPFGTGLGLSTCLHYMQALDGNITLESEKKVGTVVTLVVPKNQQGIGLDKNGH